MISFIPAAPALVLALLTAPQVMHTAPTTVETAVVADKEHGTTAPPDIASSEGAELPAPSRNLRNDEEDERTAPGFCSTLSPQLGSFIFDTWRRQQ